MVKLHPETGLHYLHVYEDGPIYDEVERAWKRVAPWLSTMRTEQWKVRKNEFLNDPSVAVTFWGSTFDAPENRRCLVAAYYTEALQIEIGAVLISEQRQMLDKFLAKAPALDLLLCHSPSASESMARFELGVPLAVMPSGYDPIAFGTPVHVRKTEEIVHFGYSTARRSKALEALDRHLRGKISIISVWGADRRELLNKSRANLCILHGKGASYPTMRIWSAISASAAFITEPGDTWPAISGRHYIEIPLYDGTTEWSLRTAKILNVFLSSRGPADAFLELAMRAHDELSAWSPRIIVNNFLVPAFEKIAFARN